MPITSLNNLRDRGKRIKDSIAINSVTPEMVGSLAIDTVETLNSLITNNQIKSTVVTTSNNGVIDATTFGIQMYKYVVNASMFLGIPNVVVTGSINSSEQCYVDCFITYGNNKQVFVYVSNTLGGIGVTSLTFTLIGF